MELRCNIRHTTLCTQVYQLRKIFFDTATVINQAVTKSIKKKSLTYYLNSKNIITFAPQKAP